MEEYLKERKSRFNGLKIKGRIIENQGLKTHNPGKSDKPEPKSKWKNSEKIKTKWKRWRSRKCRYKRWIWRNFRIRRTKRKSIRRK